MCIRDRNSLNWINMVMKGGFQSSKHISNILFGITLSSVSEFCFMSSPVAKHCGTFVVGKRKDCIETCMAYMLVVMSLYYFFVF